MKAASVMLILDKLETATTLAQSMIQASKTAQTDDSRQAGLMATVASMEAALREIQQLLAATNGYRESPYYWEDDYDSE